jgi:hypothetical protein
MLKRKGRSEARAHCSDAEKRIEFRIGIYLADLIAEGEDIFGDGVNIAARLEAPAEPGRGAGDRSRYRNRQGYTLGSGSGCPTFGVHLTHLCDT